MSEQRPLLVAPVAHTVGRRVHVRGHVRRTDGGLVNVQPHARTQVEGLGLPRPPAPRPAERPALTLQTTLAFGAVAAAPRGTSPPETGPVHWRMSPDEVAAAIALEPREHLVVFDDAGQVYRTGPEESQIAGVDPYTGCVLIRSWLPEARTLQGSLRVLHNHPSGNVLSSQDAVMARALARDGYPVRRLEATTPSGWTWSAEVGADIPTGAPLEAAWRSMGNVLGELLATAQIMAESDMVGALRERGLDPKNSRDTIQVQALYARLLLDAQQTLMEQDNYERREQDEQGHVLVLRYRPMSLPPVDHGVYPAPLNKAKPTEKPAGVVPVVDRPAGFEGRGTVPMQESLFGGRRAAPVKAHLRRSGRGVALVHQHYRHFASGSNELGEIRGWAALGHGIGVAEPELTPSARRELVAAARDGVPVFVDSGAFSEVKFGPGGPEVVREISDGDWRQRLGRTLALAEQAGPALSIVAPDRVGDQQETLNRLRRYRPEMERIAATGAALLVPLQRGALSLVDFHHAVESVMVGVPWVPAIPLKKAATAIPDLARYLAEIKPGRLHLLGLGPRSSDAEAIHDLLQRLVPDARVSGDSNLLRAEVGRSNGPGGGARRFTEASDFANDELALETWAADFFPGSTLPRWRENIGRPSDWLEGGERAEAADRLDLVGEVRDWWMMDPSGAVRVMRTEDEDSPDFWSPVRQLILDGLWARHVQRTHVQVRKERAIKEAFGDSEK